MNEPADRLPPMRSLRVLRWVLVALSATLALVLIARGNVVIGALIGALAATRVALLVQVQHRRAQMRERFAGRRR